MLIDSKYLPILKDADAGCPHSQFVIATYHFRGMKVPKNLEVAKHYYKLLADNAPEDLSFLDICYSQLLLHIGYLHYADKQDEEAVKYFNLAKAYIRDNYPTDEAEKMILESEADKYMSVIDM